MQEPARTFFDHEPAGSDWRRKLHEIIFEAETPLGKLFDIMLLISILTSVAAVMVESVERFREAHGPLLFAVEWIFTVGFTIEYTLRILAVRHPFRYMTSFFGLVDLVSVLPTYLSLFIPGAQSLMVVRAFRLMRIFRVMKLARHVRESAVLMEALRQSSRKITVFLGMVLTMVLVMGTLMYIIEGSEHGFTSIPRSMYWAIVTLTTVGYGDISPQTPLGQAFSAVIMISGYAIIAVPTGIVSVELAAASAQTLNTRSCHSCSKEGHAPDSAFCRFCGERLEG